MKSFLLLILVTQFTFAQSRNESLEDKIYNTVDLFVAHPNVESLKKLEAAEKKFNPKTKPEYLAFVILKCNKAYYENLFGFTIKAISSYEKAWQLFQNHQLKNYDITEYCLKPLGNLYTIVGDYDNAENTIKQYFFIANTENNRSQKTAAVLNLSNVYQSSGKNDQAIILLEKTINTEKLSALQKGILLNNLGANYMMVSNFGQAKKNLTASIESLKNNQAEIHTISNANRNLALIYSREQRFKIANFHFDAAKKGFFKIKNQEPRKIARLYYDEALLFFEEGKLTEVATSIKHIFEILIPDYSSQEKLLPSQNSLYAETVLIDALDLQAELFSEQKQIKKALDCYTLSFHIEELFQSMLVYENSKIITQVRNRNRTEKCIALYDVLYQQEKKIQYIKAAFQLQENTKSSILKKSISAKKNIPKEEKEILAALQNWSNAILKEQQKGDLADTLKINEAIKNQNNLMLRLKSKQVKIKNSIPQSINFPDLFKKLEHDKATMISYFYGQKNIYFFTLSKGKIMLKTIRITDELNTGIYKFIQYFSNANAIANDVRDYNFTANEMYKTFFQLDKKFENRNLLITPDGILNFIPFEALITKKTTTTNFAKMHYLLNDYKVAYNNSAGFYLNSKAFQSTKENILGVFPIFENTTSALIFSKVELDNLKKNFEGIYLEKNQATFGNFKTHSGHFSILHLSTHASAGDIFTPASIRFYDQEILYSELYALHINPDLVVLSACETGLGKLYKAEGAMSIARGFQFAGAQNLLFSLWKVNDYSTSVFMDYFYKNVKKNNSYFESNHQAKLDYLHGVTIPNAKKSPYYWSAMVYYGTLEPKIKIPYFTYFGLAILVSLVLFLLFKKTRNGKITKNPKRK